MLREITTDFANYSGRMNRSIPGEGMANDPDNPYLFEAAPEFTVQREALEYLFTLITEEERYADILIAINNDVPIMELTQVMLFKGFTEGKWNPDLMLLLAEPLAFMLIALAERQDRPAPTPALQGATGRVQHQGRHLFCHRLGGFPTPGKHPWLGLPRVRPKGGPVAGCQDDHAEL